MCVVHELASVAGPIDFALPRSIPPVMETAQLPLPHPSECGSDEWARQMRLRFSPVGMCSETGDIVQDFFRPSGLALCGEEGSRWGAAQQAALYMASSEMEGTYAGHSICQMDWLLRRGTMASCVRLTPHGTHQRRTA